MGIEDGMNSESVPHPHTMSWFADNATKYFGLSEKIEHTHIHDWFYDAGGKHTIKYCPCGDCLVLHEVKFSHGIEYKWRKIHDG